MANRMFSGLIYRAIAGEVYDDENPEYDCYCPAEYANDCVVGDCFVCDEDGNSCPGHECAVPVEASSLGEVAGKLMPMP